MRFKPVPQTLFQPVIKTPKPDRPRRVVHCERERYDVYIGRPSPWGNPFSHQPSTLAHYRVATREDAIHRYRDWLIAQPKLVARVRRELRGKILGCWCAPAPCHGDVLTEIANARRIPKPEPKKRRRRLPPLKAQE